LKKLPAVPTLAQERLARQAIKRQSESRNGKLELHEVANQKNDIEIDIAISAENRHDTAPSEVAVAKTLGRSLTIN
jgi:hypothetical protein